MTQKYEMPQGSLISFMSNKVKTHGGINFAQGIPGFQPPNKLLQKLSETSLENVHQYAPGIGNLKLRQQILEQYTKEGFTHNQLLITQGATEALSLIFQYLKNLLNNNFSALAFDPVYESYRHLPRIMQVPFFSYSQENFNIQELAVFMQNNNVKVIFINSPGNPLGSVFSKQQMDEIRTLCEAQSAYIIIDAVYRELWFEKTPYYPINNLSPNVFYVNSFSKMLSITGWRIGYFFAHEKHTEALRNIHDYIGLCVNAPLQESLALYLNEENYGYEYVKNLRSQLQNNYSLMLNRLKNVGFNVANASGGYYIWTELPNKADGFQFAMELYNTVKVAVIPGIHFSEQGKNYVRFNIARPSKEIDEGIKRIEFFSESRKTYYI